MIDIKTLQDQFETFLTATLEARTASERDRDYVDHNQWTEDEVNALKARKQAPVVINRIKTKVNLLSGVQRQRRTDPKALPRTPMHEEDADSITDALRFVADNTDMQQTSSACFVDKIVWGYEAGIVEVDPDSEYEIQVNGISPDRFYFDPFSRRLDFKDAKYMGIVLWLDEDEAKETFPDKEKEIDGLMAESYSQTEGETFDDKPTYWVDRKRKRIRVCQHYFLEKGVWKAAYITQGMYLIEPKESGYLDEHGKPSCPIEAQAAYIDRENNRYGEVRAYIWAQDEINHRRSRALHLLSARQVIMEEGAVNDANEASRQLAKADGVVVVNGDRRFEIQENSDFTAGQLSLYQDAKGDIDSIGANAALSGASEETKGLSGRAIQALQQGGIAELGSLFDGHAYWERRIYRQIWSRIKQFWNEERWIRVTDDESNLRWVTLNQRITYGELLMQKAQEGDERAQQALQQFMNDPRLNEVAMVKNNTTELDVDVVLSAAPDYATVRQEQFEMLASLAQAYGPEAVPFDVMLELSDLPHKEAVKEMLKPKDVDPQQQEAQQQMAAELAQQQYRKLVAEADKAELEPEAMKAKIAKDMADAEAQAIENAFVKTFGLTPDGMKQSLTVSTGA